MIRQQLVMWDDLAHRRQKREVREYGKRHQTVAAQHRETRQEYPGQYYDRKDHPPIGSRRGDREGSRILGDGGWKDQLLNVPAVNGKRSQEVGSQAAAPKVDAFRPNAPGGGADHGLVDHETYYRKAQN